MKHTKRDTDNHSREIGSNSVKQYFCDKETLEFLAVNKVNIKEKDELNIVKINVSRTKEFKCENCGYLGKRYHPTTPFPTEFDPACPECFHTESLSQTEIR